MKIIQAKNRELAVQAITQRNHLKRLVTQTKIAVEKLDVEVRTAHNRGLIEREYRLLTERDQHQKILIEIKAALQSADITTEDFKAEIQCEEEEIREKTAMELTRLLDLKKYFGGGPGGPAAA